MRGRWRIRSKHLVGRLVFAGLLIGAAFLLWWSFFLRFPQIQEWRQQSGRLSDLQSQTEFLLPQRRDKLEARLERQRRRLEERSFAEMGRLEEWLRGEVKRALEQHVHFGFRIQPRQEPTGEHPPGMFVVPIILAQQFSRDAIRNPPERLEIPPASLDYGFPEDSDGMGPDSSFEGMIMFLKQLTGASKRLELREVSIVGGQGQGIEEAEFQVNAWLFQGDVNAE